MKLIFLGIYLFFLSYQNAFAYSHYIRLGYHSCIGCHYNPSGGGMLTPYGKGISSAQSLHSTELSETEQEKLEEKLSTEKYFQGFQGRLLNYKTVIKNRFFPMQAEYFGRYDINPTWKINFSVAVSPKPENENPTDPTKAYQRTYARVAEINYNYDPKHLFFAGISPLPLGLGLVDHTAFVRANNRLQITDIPFNFRAYTLTDNYTYNYFLFLPHYLESHDNKEKGLGGQYWYLINKNLSLGAQGLVGSSHSIKRKLAGFLLKGGHLQFSYLGEADYTHRTLSTNNIQFGQWAYYNEFNYHATDWFKIAYGLQGLIKDRDFESNETRHSFMLEAKLLRSFTFMYETRLRRSHSTNEVSHLIQGFYQWW